MLKISNLTKKYGDVVAVDNLSLQINPGEVFGFIGHNGAGKTTTIKACCGIHPFNSGEILVNGISVSKNPIEAKKTMAYIPDNPDLYDFLTGIKYLNFVSDVYNLSSIERQTEISKYSELFGLADHLNDNISTYSHGMKQKLALISAFIHHPKLLILDEPFVGLDPKSSHTLKLEMRKLCDEGGAIFFSTHVLDVAEKICDKIAIIKDGKLVVCGTTQEVKGDSSLEDVFLELEDKNAEIVD